MRYPLILQFLFSTFMKIIRYPFLYFISIIIYILAEIINHHSGKIYINLYFYDFMIYMPRIQKENIEIDI